MLHHSMDDDDEKQQEDAEEEPHVYELHVGCDGQGVWGVAEEGVQDEECGETDGHTNLRRWRGKVTVRRDILNAALSPPLFSCP